MCTLKKIIVYNIYIYHIIPYYTPQCAFNVQVGEKAPDAGQTVWPRIKRL